MFSSYYFLWLKTLWDNNKGKEYMVKLYFILMICYIEVNLYFWFTILQNVLHTFIFYLSEEWILNAVRTLYSIKLNFWHAVKITQNCLCGICTWHFELLWRAMAQQPIISTMSLIQLNNVCKELKIWCYYLVLNSPCQKVVEHWEYLFNESTEREDAGLLGLAL